MKALKTKDYDRAPGVLFREAKFLMSTMFASSSVIYASRLCNSVAHELACLGRDRDPDHPAVWIDPLPVFVMNILACDHPGPGSSE